MKNTLFLLLLLTSVLPLHAREWAPDILGKPFWQTTIQLPDDYAGKSVCTVVRALTDSAVSRAVLYVHGYNDYFFQRSMATQFLCHGYGFYAVDLRRYGRSLRKGDTPYDIRDINAYSAEIDSTLAIMRDDGISEVVMLGHSTGGLITATYLSHHHPAEVKALILNSPFLDWNLGNLEKLVPAIAAVGRLFPAIKIPQGESTAYAESLMKSAHGEWQYDTIWKRTVSLPVTTGWIRAIDNAQRDLRKDLYPIKVPVLLMMSGQSISAQEWTPEVNRADAVLDVDDILYYGQHLSRDVKPIRFKGGLHDLALSSCPVRCNYYNRIFSWISTIPGL